MTDARVSALPPDHAGAALRPALPDVAVPPQPLAALVAPLLAAGLLAPEHAPDTTDARTNAPRMIVDVADDSRRVRPGSLFGAIAGDFFDGHQFAEAAADAGAAAVLVSRAWAEAREAPKPLGKGERLRGAALVPVSDTRAALAEVAAAFYGHPGRALRLVGVTGTNGKTTTAFLLHHLFTALGETAGLVGTVENRIGAARFATAYTTPEAPALQRLLRAMADAGCTACAMEVSSHGLALERVRTLPFRVAVFTNLTHDHLDFHGTPEAYAAAKRLLFDRLEAGAVALVNADDPAHAFMTARTAARVVTFGTGPAADVRVDVLENALGGLRLRLTTAAEGARERRFRLAGRFNALNLAAAYGAALALGYDADAALDALATAPGVPGRFETTPSPDGVLGVVDYAHTPDALENVLRTAREILPQGGRLWVVFGCGGDRDRAKRPAMARAAEALADVLVVTDDNPRTEDPAAIRADVRAGLARPAAAREIGDRAEAIAHAAAEARPGDIVVVAGKGHETYQIVGAERRPFDDRAALAAALARRAPSPTAEAR